MSNSSSNPSGNPSDYTEGAKLAQALKLLHPPEPGLQKAVGTSRNTDSEDSTCSGPSNRSDGPSSTGDKTATGLPRQFLLVPGANQGIAYEAFRSTRNDGAGGHSGVDTSSGNASRNDSDQVAESDGESGGIVKGGLWFMKA